MNIKLILVRHGQSQWNLENRFTGWHDVDITETGKEEARTAGILLKNLQIDIAFTSTLLRAQHTLDIILQTCGLEKLPIIQDKALNERCYGDLEGLNKADIAQKYGEEQVYLWRRSYDVAPPGGESLNDTYNRVIPYFQHYILPQLLIGKSVAVVAHGNSMRALIMFLENLSPEEILHKELPTGIPEIYTMKDDFLRSLKKPLRPRYKKA